MGACVVAAAAFFNRTLDDGQNVQTRCPDLFIGADDVMAGEDRLVALMMDESALHWR